MPRPVARRITFGIMHTAAEPESASGSHRRTRVAGNSLWSPIAAGAGSFRRRSVRPVKSETVGRFRRSDAVSA